MELVEGEEEQHQVLRGLGGMQEGTTFDVDNMIEVSASPSGFNHTSVLQPHAIERTVFSDDNSYCAVAQDSKAELPSSLDTPATQVRQTGSVSAAPVMLSRYHKI